MSEMFELLSVPKRNKRGRHRRSTSSSAQAHLSSYETSSSDDDSRSSSVSVTQRLRRSCCLGDRRHRGSSESRPPSSPQNTGKPKSSKGKKHLSLSWSSLDTTVKPNKKKIINVMSLTKKRCVSPVVQVVGVNDNVAQGCQSVEGNDDIECSSTVRVICPNDVSAVVEPNSLPTQ
jgi:hypothetical protein